MDHYKEIYKTKAREYHKLISAEDVEGNLIRTFERLADFRDARVLDLGTGTGRIPFMLHEFTPNIIGLDLHDAMLREQQVQQQKLGLTWDLTQGDVRVLPFPNDWTDVSVAGWALGHFLGWFGEKWQTNIDQALSEMQRVTKPGGLIIIIETLGTGSNQPAPPVQELADYYAYIENIWGFEKSEIPTDYKFRNLEEAVQTTEFFFGPELSDKIRSENWVRLPEWTGIWSKRQPT
jgi:ubiquinone/menaquinone biosynthesis C-methylase UbiE